MWLTSSSIGRKFVMAITGICLVLFVTFHCLMNSVALLWPAAYNVICQFLGANWYALVASAGLAFLFIMHIIYALWLTIQNRRARGADRYAVSSRPPQVEWSSKNMLVLGIVVLAFLAIHLIQFWAKMQLAELTTHELSAFPMVEGVPAAPHFGTLYLQIAFSQWWTLVVYLIGFGALWLHMNHGFWSMFHTIGWNSNIWTERLKKIACWWTSIVIALFAAQAILFTVQAHNKFFVNDPALQEQYVESIAEAATPVIEEFIADYNQAGQLSQMMRSDAPIRQFMSEKGEYYKAKFAPFAAISATAAAQSNQVLGTAGQIINMINEYSQPQEPALEQEETEVEALEVTEPQSETNI